MRENHRKSAESILSETLPYDGWAEFFEFFRADRNHLIETGSASQPVIMALVNDTSTINQNQTTSSTRIRNRKFQQGKNHIFDSCSKSSMPHSSINIFQLSVLISQLASLSHFSHIFHKNPPQTAPTQNDHVRAQTKAHSISWHDLFLNRRITLDIYYADLVFTVVNFDIC